MCVVTALAAVYAAHRVTFKSHPREGDAVFKKNKTAAITRREISTLLKLAADGCGIPHARIASHSLRRGGATQFVASGLSDEHTMRHGRWTSTAYGAYVFGHSEAMKAALMKAVHLVPCLERN